MSFTPPVKFEAAQEHAVGLAAEGRDVEPVGAAPVHAEREMRPLAPRRKPRRHITGAERAGLGLEGQRQRPLAPAGGDVDHAADGVGAVERAHRPADDLDALDVVGRQVGEVELAVGGVVGLHAVDQHQRVVALGAADAHLREIAVGAGAADGDARQAAECVRHLAHLLALQILARDDGDGVADACRGNALGIGFLGVGLLGIGLLGVGLGLLRTRRSGGFAFARRRARRLQGGALHGDGGQLGLGEPGGRQHDGREAQCSSNAILRRRTHDASPNAKERRRRP